MTQPPVQQENMKFLTDCSAHVGTWVFDQSGVSNDLMNPAFNLPSGLFCSLPSLWGEIFGSKCWMFYFLTCCCQVITAFFHTRLIPAENQNNGLKAVKKKKKIQKEERKEKRKAPKGPGELQSWVNFSMLVAMNVTQWCDPVKIRQLLESVYHHKCFHCENCT